MSTIFAGKQIDERLCPDLPERYEWVLEMLQHKPKELKALSKITIEEGLAPFRQFLQYNQFQRPNFPGGLKRAAALVGVSTTIRLRRLPMFAPGCRYMHWRSGEIASATDAYFV